MARIRTLGDLQFVSCHRRLNGKYECGLDLQLDDSLIDPVFAEYDVRYLNAGVFDQHGHLQRLTIQGTSVGTSDESSARLSELTKLPLALLVICRGMGRNVLYVVSHNNRIVIYLDEPRPVNKPDKYLKARAKRMNNLLANHNIV